LNPAYLPIADVSEIGLFGEILPDESIVWGGVSFVIDI